MPRRKIYDFCLRRDEEKINVLESDWSHPEVVSKWYAVGIMPADEDSDQDDDQVRKKEYRGLGIKLYFSQRKKRMTMTYPMESVLLKVKATTSMKEA